MKLFLDTEFTGLNSQAQLISLAMVAEDGVSFYAEFTDFNNEVSSWLKNHVIGALILDDMPENTVLQASRITQVRGTTEFIKGALLAWLTQFPQVEIWGDCLAHDWVLTFELLVKRDGDQQPEFPGNFTSPYPRDLFDYFCECGNSLEEAWGITRSKFAQLIGFKERYEHNALWGARIISACYEKLSDLKKAEQDVHGQIKAAKS
jgi:hypothetical protein